MLLVKASFVTMYLRGYLMIGKKHSTKHWEQINAIDGVLTENFS